MTVAVSSLRSNSNARGPSRGLWRRLVERQLHSLRGGGVTIEQRDGIAEFGERTDLQAGIRVNESRFFRLAATGGSLAVAESYLNGDWDCDNLTALFRIFLRNRDAANGLDRGFARLARVAHRLYHFLHANSRGGSQRNIHAHYDLGNDFFRLWLDESLAYSSGIFPSPRASLHQASLEKFDRVCRKLDLRPGDHLLEIGTGWGGLAIHAAANYGCRVTTTTISREQYEVARSRIAAAGLSELITLRSDDYRDLRGRFDKLASIEMIEAVGHRRLDRFFHQCGELLRPEGTCVLQAIVMPDRGFDRYLKSVDFIQRYVFPGGCLPSMGSMLQSVARSTDLRFVHAEDFAPHYAETLRRWRTAFHEHLDGVRAMGFSERFIRLWNYYLCYCEAAFEERATGVVQIQFDKPGCRRDPLQIGAHAACEPDFAVAANDASRQQPQSAGSNTASRPSAGFAKTVLAACKNGVDR